MRQKKHSTDEDISEAWLLPYSDMMTLLLSLFIVLFAVSNVDKAKLKQLESEFGTILATKSQASADKQSLMTANQSNNTIIEPIDKFSIQRQNEQQLLQHTFQSTQKDIKNSPLNGKVQVTLQSDGIHLTLNSDVLFTTESAELTPQMQSALKLLAPHLKPLQQNNIIIAGYTDNLPITNQTPYPSNWELSSARAISVMKYFVSQNIFQANKVTIEAFADNNPVASNNDAAGRAKNRRVEIIIHRVF